MDFEKYKKMFDKNFGKVTPEEFIEEMKSLGYKFEEIPLRPSFWFMVENHTFIKLKGKNIDEVTQHAIEVAKENPYGMVCPVTIHQGEKELRRVGGHCHVYKDGFVDLSKWLCEIMKEDCVRNYKGEE